MNSRQRISWGALLLLVWGLTACEVKRPSEVLPDSKMEAVLYDYHLAKAVGEEYSRGENYKKALFIESVYRKHGITEADFDTTMVWYARHPDALAKVYERVNKRLRSERDGINHLIALRDNKPQATKGGDSVDVWMQERICRLSGTPMDNRLAFSMAVDTNFYPRDTVRWSVGFRFLGEQPDSAHAPLMALQMVYEKNDTTVSASLRIPVSGRYQLSVWADTLGSIQTVRGFIYYPAPLSESHPLLLEDISLMRYHAQGALETPVAKDSVAVTEEPVRRQEVRQPALHADKPRRLVADSVDSQSRPLPVRPRPTHKK